MRTAGFVIVGLSLLAGCGGATRSVSDDHAPAGGSGGSEAGSSAVAGSPPSGGAGGVAGGGGTASGGTTTTPVGGTRAMEPPGGAGGSAGHDPSSCAEPYSGAMGGPRMDGPAPILGACESIPDDVLKARFQSWDERVASGFYYEPTTSLSAWHSPCSMSEEETAMRGSPSGRGALEATYTSPWFYEATYCDSGLRRSVRNLRCDYFDGDKLAEHTPKNLAFLGSLLWWRSNHDLQGSAILGYAVMIGDATDWVDVCTLSGTQGDFGLCDEIRLERTRHSVFYDGTVSLGEPEVVRTIMGTCH